MRRRDFVMFFSGATAWMAAASAQEPRRVIGVLGSASYGAFPGAEVAFLQGLKATGFFEGSNISVEWRWAEGQYNRLSLLAGELSSCNVAVIVTFDAPASFAAKAATKTTPIVFLTGVDPVTSGLVDTFHPVGNLTGATTFVGSLGPKQFGLLRELLPRPRQGCIPCEPEQSEHGLIHLKYRRRPMSRATLRGANSQH